MSDFDHSIEFYVYIFLVDASKAYFNSANASLMRRIASIMFSSEVA